MKKAASKRIYFILLAVIITAFLQASCGSPKSYSPSNQEIEAPEFSEDGAFPQANYGVNNFKADDVAESNYEKADSDYNVVDSNRKVTDAKEISEADDIKPEKIIYSYFLEYRVRDFEQFYDFINDRIDAYDGFIDNQEYYSEGNKRSDLEISIPQKKAERFLEDLLEMQEPTSMTQSARNITKSYYDKETRVEVLEELIKTYTLMLSSANSMEDVIAIQSKIDSLNFEKEELQSDLKTADQKVAYASFNVIIQQVKDEVISEKTDDPFDTRLEKAAKTAWIDAVRGVQNFAVDFVMHLPALIISLLLLLILILIIKGIRRRSAKRKKQKMDEEDARWEKRAKLFNNAPNMNYAGPPPAAVPMPAIPQHPMPAQTPAPEALQNNSAKNAPEAAEDQADNKQDEKEHGEEKEQAGKSNKRQRSNKDK